MVDNCQDEMVKRALAKYGRFNRVLIGFCIGISVLFVCYEFNKELPSIETDTTTEERYIILDKEIDA